MEKRKSRWGHEYAYWIGRQEFATLQRGRTLDVRVTRQEERLIRKTRMYRGTVFMPRPSDWISIKLRNRRDLETALKLVRIALRNNRQVE